MADARISQLTVRSLDVSGPTLRLSQVAVRSIYNFPSEAARLSQVVVRSLDQPSPNLRTGQLIVRAIVRGRIANPTIRAWTFTLDGHDYYVLRLGDANTLVYDVYSEQWMDWADLQSATWRANCGVNWLGGQSLAIGYGSNVVVGDDSLGLLWFLDPNQPFDGSPDSGGSPIYFDRITMGQIVQTGREVLPCYAAWLTTDMAAPAYTGAGVTLEISDDAGVTFNNMGNIVVTLGVNSPELSWYSLGQIAAPGRLFKITDDGAVARIDTFEMNDPDDDDGG